MEKLFERDRSIIIKHMNTIFRENELNKNEVCEKFAHTIQHGEIIGKS